MTQVVGPVMITSTPYPQSHWPLGLHKHHPVWTAGPTLSATQGGSGGEKAVSCWVWELWLDVRLKMTVDMQWKWRAWRSRNGIGCHGTRQSPMARVHAQVASVASCNNDTAVLQHSSLAAASIPSLMSSEALDVSTSPLSQTPCVFWGAETEHFTLQVLEWKEKGVSSLSRLCSVGVSHTHNKRLLAQH